MALWTLDPTAPDIPQRLAVELQRARQDLQRSSVRREFNSRVVTEEALNVAHDLVERLRQLTRGLQAQDVDHAVARVHSLKGSLGGMSALLSARSPAA